MVEPNRLMGLFYTVERAVGRGCPNQSDDVALVQFLVRRVLEGWNDALPGPPLVIDGIFGERTQRNIEHFQKGTNRVQEGNMHEDGIVSPMRGREAFTRAGNVYTIVRLNTHYADRWGPAWHSNLAIDPACPRHLLPSIFFR